MRKHFRDLGFSRRQFLIGSGGAAAGFLATNGGFGQLLPAWSASIICLSNNLTR